MSRGVLLRAMGCALDWLDQIPDASFPSVFDEHLTPLALARLAVKLEFTFEHQDIVLKLLAADSVAENMRLWALECRLVMALPMQPWAASDRLRLE